ncbi:hypothetical protein DICSQDRAFT_123356 [Dichomitus squalens LYAD-421 SS1]|uniref:uncharacterized protein n=1 Tax=Dichomitus squalens (strain LYAD-421) TaxID=732165 RepID=UPI0004413B52|nr:uncharacterized protein DICSQDRAFT_123356 [Dichomitus squalens LYAD-421 SS1]EJF66793.1 hypothetical protein DICSQDRAFT_123356 [Dichomitus squalens LYAD-421 SS1]
MDRNESPPPPGPSQHRILVQCHPQDREAASVAMAEDDAAVEKKRNEQDADDETWTPSSSQESNESVEYEEHNEGNELGNPDTPQATAIDNDGSDNDGSDNDGSDTAAEDEDNGDDTEKSSLQKDPGVPDYPPALTFDVLLEVLRRRKKYNGPIPRFIERYISGLAKLSYQEWNVVVKLVRENEETLAKYLAQDSGKRNDLKEDSEILVKAWEQSWRDFYGWTRQ